MPDPVNILLVDDKPQNLSVLESILDSPDYRLTKAESAQEALVALFATDFALIVLDVQMPETSGFELAQIIKERKRTRDIPIIFVTAHYAEDEHVLSGYSAGAVDYLTKPVNPAILKSKVAIFAELHRKTKALNESNAALQSRNQELLAANRELEAFSYTVSHDLRAPLRHVSGFIQALRERAEENLDAEARRYLDKVENAASDMGKLIDHLLAFSRMGRAELRVASVDMNELLQRARDELQPEIQGRHIEWCLAKLPKVQADASLMRQVWTNLLSNAVKYTRPRDPARIEVGCEDSPREFVFFVRDNGVGFDMKYADKLFGVFQRLHRAQEFEGTGIGLANVRRIITRHGGQTWAEGKLNAGTTISFTLRKPALIPN
jgi:two-component system, sensor histidine kinase and response regulator